MISYINFLDTYQDFPKSGVNFYCLARLYREMFHELVRDIATNIRHEVHPKQPLTFVGIEARGFILAAGLASAMGKGVMMVRKKGKLPGPFTISQPVALEYGETELEVYRGRGRVIVCDDVVATGGSMLGAENLLREAGYEVATKVCILNLKHLNTIPNSDLFSLLDVWQ
jgi:adenine phosphoribosyltransferase